MGCEAPQGLVPDQGRSTPPAACFPHGHAGKELQNQNPPLQWFLPLPYSQAPHWDALHQPDPLWVTQTPGLKWPPGPGTPWHTQGQVQPSSKGGCCTAATMPVGPLAATSITQRCSGCLEQWIAHKQGRALCRDGSCICSPRRTETRASSPCTVSFWGLTESSRSCSTSSSPCHSSLLGCRLLTLHLPKMGSSPFTRQRWVPLPSPIGWAGGCSREGEQVWSITKPQEEASCNLHPIMVPQQEGTPATSAVPHRTSAARLRKGTTELLHPSPTTSLQAGRSPQGSDPLCSMPGQPIKAYGTFLATSRKQSASFQGASASRGLQTLPEEEKQLRRDPSCLHCASLPSQVKCLPP